MYVVMEFIDGESLYEYVESVEKLTEEEVFDILLLWL